MLGVARHCAGWGGYFYVHCEVVEKAVVRADGEALAHRVTGAPATAAYAGGIASPVGNIVGLDTEVIADEGA